VKAVAFHAQKAIAVILSEIPAAGDAMRKLVYARLSPGRHLYLPVLMLSLASTSLTAQGQKDLTPSQVFEKVRGSVVVVKSLNAEGKATMQGSGVKLPSGRIITNFHVVKEGSSFLVGQGGHFVPATIYAADAQKDLCLLEAPSLKVRNITLGRASSLKVGANVYAVGSPEGLELSLSGGLVSQLHGTAPPIIQTTAAISHGSSGGGLFNPKGHLVGITTSSYEAGQNLNFALPVEWAEQLKPGTPPVSAAPSEGEWLTHSMKLSDGKNWAELLIWSQKWVRARERDPLAWEHLANAYFWLDHYNEAVDASRQAVKLDPNSSSAWLTLSLSAGFLNHREEKDEAYRHYQWASNQQQMDHAKDIERENRRMEWFEKSSSLSREGKWPEMIGLYQQWAAECKDDPSPWEFLGLGYLEHNQVNQALKTFLDGTRFFPNEKDLWTGLGKTYDKLNRPNDAIEAYRNVVVLWSEHAGVWFELGEVLRKHHRQNESKNAYQRVISIWRSQIKTTLPEDRGLIDWSMLAMSYYYTGDRKAALEAVQELRKLDPAEADKLINLIKSK
jgi:tetratricopeptide (TPR) repeat protein